jgi:AcrR family transcriptional regulator
MSAIIERANGYTHSRVGRPRANPRPLQRPPEEEILVEAARLFAQKGFAATSTREIAEAAGLRQPSLFHYYPKKECILETLLRRVAEWTLDFAEQLEHVDGPSAAKLYRLLYFDVHSACASSHPVHAILLMPEARAPSFPAFAEADERLVAVLSRFIANAIAEGDLRATDVELTARCLRSLAASTAMWASQCEDRSAEAIASHVVGKELRALLDDPGALDRVRQQADNLRI